MNKKKLVLFNDIMNFVSAISRVWLVLVSILFLGIGGVMLALSLGLLQLSRDAVTVLPQTIKIFDVNSIAYGNCVKMLIIDQC